MDGLILRAPIWNLDRKSILDMDCSFECPEILALELSSSLAELVVRPADPPYSKSYDQSWVTEDLENDWSVVAVSEARIVGIVVVHWSQWNQRCELNHIYVDKPFRGAGIGGTLLDRAIDHAISRGARCLWAETQNTNIPAVQFYRKHGFALCGFDTELYGQDTKETALFFSKTLRFDSRQQSHPC